MPSKLGHRPVVNGASAWLRPRSCGLDGSTVPTAHDTAAAAIQAELIARGVPAVPPCARLGASWTGAARWTDADGCAAHRLRWAGTCRRSPAATSKWTASTSSRDWPSVAGHTWRFSKRIENRRPKRRIAAPKALSCLPTAPAVPLVPPRASKDRSAQGPGQAVLASLKTGRLGTPNATENLACGEERGASGGIVRGRRRGAAGGQTTARPCAAGARALTPTSTQTPTPIRRGARS